MGNWNGNNNSITTTISSDRATQIEIYSSGGTKVATINGTSGSFVFYHNATHNNGNYYVRVKNTAGYNSGSFPFVVSGLDKVAPAAHTITMSSNGWASSKHVTVTATDQTNARFELQYEDGTVVPYCTEKEGSMVDGKFTTSWAITEQITSSKVFRLVSTDRWGYRSIYNFSVNQIDTLQPTAPTIHKSPSKEWHNGTVSIAISGGTAASGIAQYEYRINDGEWDIGDSFTLSSQGEYIVEARTLSNAGLRSASVSSTVKIDTTKPSGNYTLSHMAGVWTTDAVTIHFFPNDSGGSGVQRVILPNGQSTSNLDSITYLASQNGVYDFIVFDEADNRQTVTVNIEHIAMLDVTVTLNTPFVISPDKDAVYGGNIRFVNNSNVPITLTMQRMEPLNGAPEIVAPDSFNWKSLSVRDTQRYAAIGFTGNGKDFWHTGESQSLGVINKDSDTTYTFKAKHGYAWESPQSLLYAITMKVSIYQ